MLYLTIPSGEIYDERTNMFVYMKEQTLQLEHSLVSLSKWEAKWCKPFLTKTEKTVEETVDYIRCMTVNQGVDPLVYTRLRVEDFLAVNKYIEAPMTATTFSNTQKGGSNSEQVTSELIYYWMIALNIPFECQKWHLNRLLTLIRVCEVKNTPPKKMSKREIMSRNAALNAARRKKLGTKG